MRPKRILDWGVKELRNNKIPIIRDLWRSAQIEEETWEREFEMRKKYPKLFEQPGMRCKTSLMSRMKFILKGENVKPNKILGKKPAYTKHELRGTNRSIIGRIWGKRETSSRLTKRGIRTR